MHRPARAELLAVKDAEFRVGVTDIDDQNHGYCSPSRRRLSYRRPSPGHAPFGRPAVPAPPHPHDLARGRARTRRRGTGADPHRVHRAARAQHLARHRPGDLRRPHPAPRGTLPPPTAGGAHHALRHVDVSHGLPRLDHPAPPDLPARAGRPVGLAAAPRVHALPAHQLAQRQHLRHDRGPAIPAHPPAPRLPGLHFALRPGGRRPGGRDRQVPHLRPRLRAGNRRAHGPAPRPRQDRQPGPRRSQPARQPPAPALLASLHPPQPRLLRLLRQRRRRRRQAGHRRGRLAHDSRHRRARRQAHHHPARLARRPAGPRPHARLAPRAAEFGEGSSGHNR